MRYSLIFLFFLGHFAHAQYEDFYVVENGVKTAMQFSIKEIESLDYESTFVLKHKKRKRKKKIIKEYSTGTVKFIHSDSTYWIGFTKFYDEYFIALIARRKEVKKSHFELYGHEFRRIFYSEMEYFQTAGKNKLFWPKLLLGSASLTGGVGITIGSISANPVLVPVGLAVSTIGYLILHPLTTKNYHFPDWNYEVEISERKTDAPTLIPQSNNE